MKIKFLVLMIALILPFAIVAQEDDIVGDDAFDSFSDTEESEESFEQEPEPEKDTAPLEKAESEKKETEEKTMEQAEKKEEPSIETVEKKPVVKPIEEKKEVVPNGIKVWEWNNMYVKLGGYLQARFEHVNNDENNEADSLDKFYLNKARLSFKGQLAWWSHFKIEFDVWDYKTYSMVPVEVYAGFPLIRYFNLKAGLIKVPIVYQNMMSGSGHLFAETPMVVSGHVTRTKSTHSGQKNFPSKDEGVMIEGDIFPWPELTVFKNWPKGILRYYFSITNGDSFKAGASKNEKFMYAFRGELNPFGYKGIKESDFSLKDPYMTVAFNFAKNIDSNSNYEKDKDAEMFGVDGYMGWMGIALSGGWYLWRSAGDKAYESMDYYDYAWQSMGFFIQLAGFLPIPKFNRNIELKVRYQQYDPFSEVSADHRPEDTEEYTDYANFFVPVTHLTDREARVITAGINFYLDLMGRKNLIKASFEYSWRDELEPFMNSDGDKVKTQIRNDNFIFEVQLKL